METDTAKSTPEEKIDFFLLSAHELRTSLSAMKWLFAMLRNGDYGPLNSEQLTAIDQAIKANETMITLLNTTMTTIKDGAVITYAELPVQLPALLAESIKEFTNEAAAKHIALTYHQPPAPVSVVGDEGKLRIAFHNIIENAIKYSPDYTEVVISLSLTDTMASITVQDHGIGVAPEQAVHLFEKFFRANSSSLGTGLGLYSTKLIIEHHGGTIAMHSEPGKGSTVSIALPLKQ